MLTTKCSFFIYFKFYSSFFCVFLFLQKCSPQTQGQLADILVEKIGTELNKLATVITNSTEIKNRFNRMVSSPSEIVTSGSLPHLNASIVKSDPKSLLKEVVENIGRMMEKKMDAIKCIYKKAEEAAEFFQFDEERNFDYFSSKYSNIFGTDTDEEVEIFNSLNCSCYRNITVNYDTHFYNLPVNTNHSAVHVPTNVFDRHENPREFIEWSEVLDEVFRQNYKSDPALHWQYFGSSTGVMRFYPAMRWVKSHDQDLYDCRIQTWFIEAATCTKDVVILVDNSGSMSGVRKHIATITVFRILETLSNNDYVNIMNFSNTVDYLVPCFRDVLAQATKENIQFFKQHMLTLNPNEKANLNKAMEKSFDLLRTYREQRNTSMCNQAIIILTDDIPDNLTQIVKNYNYFGNDSSVTPVRIFVYTIGNEVTNSQEGKTLACSNRGFYSQIEALEQVSESVYEYIPVIARPLVLYDTHPISWTHAYADMTYKQDENNYFEEYRLLTTIAVPVFDTKINKRNESRTANLLGVAATDIPITEIEKLTLPHKIGVNAYSFIVSQNGYVLKHPDLRPLYKGDLTINYNSIDLTEVEQLDNDRSPRDPDENILKLRGYLVAGITDTLPDIKVKYHYDEMRRVSREIFDYYFAPIENTPFSLAIAIANSYGNYSLEVGDEIGRNYGIDLTTFFEGNNWKIHPKWVYCKYHYLEGHEFPTPEEELLHFLKKISEENFKWTKQYEKKRGSSAECGSKTLDDDDYYCDKDLIQRLIFDAKITLIEFEKPLKFDDDTKTLLAERYNAVLRFVATIGGLTRWEYLSFNKEKYDDSSNSSSEFGDRHPQAIDEIWYKEAVIQHRHDPDSFVYSVPFEEYTDETLVTASYAIFPKIGEIETPASVVGFQFSHSKLYDRFFYLVKNNSYCGNNSQCKPCGEYLSCYLVDSSGYIIVAENKNLTSQFFGEVEGDIMECMLAQNIFENVTIYDLQGVHIYNFSITSDSNILQTPLKFFASVINWFLAKMFWLFMESQFYSCLYSNPVSASYCYTDEDSFYSTTTTTSTTSRPTTTYQKRKGEVKEEEEYHRRMQQPRFELRRRACDKMRDIFILKQSLFLDNIKFPEHVPGDCSRKFYVKKIPKSNLIFVAVDEITEKEFFQRKYCTVKKRVVDPYHYDYPCRKLYLNNLTRRILSNCYCEHPLEHEIKTCARCSSNRFLYRMLLITLVVFLLK